MAFQASFVLSHKPSAVVTKGTMPRKPMSWTGHVWIVLPDGEKNRHSISVGRLTWHELIQYMHALVDSVIVDHGRQCIGAGWEVSSHGRRK